jgi:hypothetical protein
VYCAHAKGARMTLEPLLHAPLPVQIHVATVVPAFFVGTYLIFVSRKGARHHRVLGYLYLSLMTITAVAALFVRAIMPNSPFSDYRRFTCSFRSPCSTLWARCAGPGATTSGSTSAPCSAFILADC